MPADVLRAALEGEVIGPEDAGFDQSRKAFNAMVDARPAAIARCASREDVIRAVAVAAERELAIAVRGGGTSDACTVDGGVQLDLAELDAIEIDAPTRIARVGGGVTWGELDEATQEHGLAVTGARLSGLGVAGVALGDGSGWLERALGPTAASVVGAEVVLADGRVADAASDSELLWALRGAGAGLGVVTRLDLALHPVGPELVSGFLGFPRSRAAEVARAYRDYMALAPEEVGGGLVLGAGRGGACTIVFSHLGTIAAGEEAVAPLRALGPSLDAVAANPDRAFQRIWDASNPPGARVRVARAFLRELSDECIDAVIARADLRAARLSYAVLQPLGGRLADGRRDEMAHAIPDAAWACQCVGLCPPVPALDRGQLAWVDGFAEAVEPFAAAQARAASERRLAVKRRYDPRGIFGS
jgi:FAD/FMN-containing dehydrogenase